MPEAIAAAILGELDALSAPARRLAEASAVAGDPFDLDLAIATAAMDDRAALPALDELLGQDLVRPADVPRRFRFRHPLVRRAVYGACPLGARLRAHERTAGALAARGAPPAARAHHVEHAARPGDLEAVAVLREAGLATAGRAPESAARWFGIALGLLPEDARPGDRVELLTALAGAHAATGRFEDSRAALLESIALTPDAEDGPRVGLIGACAGLEQLLGHHEAARTRLTAALHRRSGAASPEAVELMILLAVGDFYRVDYEAMRAWGVRALGAATELDVPSLTAASTAVLALAAAILAAVPEARRHSSAAAALVDAMPDEELGLRLDALANLATAELYLHRYAAAGAHAQRGLAIAQATGQGEISPVLVPVLSNVLHVTGRVAESAALLDGAVEAARLSGNAQSLGWNLLSRSFTALAAGDVPIALGAAQESVEVTRDLDDGLVSTYASVALASALYEDGEAGRAIEVLLAAAGGEALPAIAARLAGELLRAADALLAGRGRTPARPAPRPSCGRGDRGGARAPARPRRWPTGPRRPSRWRTSRRSPPSGRWPRRARPTAWARGWRRPVRGRSRAGRWPAAAIRRARWPSSSAPSTSSTCAGRSATATRRSASCAASGGRCTGARGRAAATGPGSRPSPQREAEVAHLVVDRRTNPEIATELFLSVKTVETHLRTIFRKLDVPSRYELARVIEHAEHGG